MSRVEIPAPADLLIDAAGNVLAGRTVTVKLAGTATVATHYSALTGGTSTTGGLVTHTDGTVVNGSAARRYVDSGQPLDITIGTLTRRVEPRGADDPDGPLNVKSPPYKATGDGTTDDATALRLAVADARSQGRPLYIPKGRYRCTQQLTQGGQTGPLVVFGDGPDETVLLHEVGSVFGPSLFAHGGSIGSNVLLTANVAVGAQIITLASTTGIVVGDYGVLRDHNQVRWGTSPDEIACVEGEVVRVQSIDSGTQLTVHGGVTEYYTRFTGTDATGKVWANDNCNFRKLTLQSGHSFRDFTIENANTPDVYPNGAARGFTMDYSLGFRSENIRLRNLSSDGWRMAFAVSFSVRGCESLNDATYGGGHDGHYMVSPHSGSSGTIHDCTMWEGRHLTTAGGAPSTGGADSSGYDIGSRHVTVAHCHRHGGHAASFDTHAPGKSWIFDTCVSDGTSREDFGDASGGEGNVGFQIRSQDVTIINPVVTGAPVLGIAAYGGAVRFRLIGGTIKGAKTTGLRLERLNDAWVSGTRIYATAAQTNGITIERHATYNVPMKRLRIENIEIIGDPTSPITNGVNFISGSANWQPDFRLSNIEMRNVTNKYVGIPHDRTYGSLVLADANYETLKRVGVPAATIAPLSSGRLTLVGIDLPIDELVSIIGFYGGAAETTPTNLWYSLYDSALALLGVTNDLTTTAMGLTVPRELTLATPYRTTYPGLHYLGITQVAAAVSQLRGVGVSSNLALRPPPITGHGTTGLTNPASAPNPSIALTANALMPYAYVR